MKRFVHLSATAACVAFATAVTAQGSDAEQNPVMVGLTTGSEVATWTLLPEKPVHKTPVVFLHGGPGMYTTPGAMNNGALLRTAGFTTVYFDQAGSGKSKRLSARDYTIDRAVADLEALRVTLGRDKVILWGNSYGASLATVYAARYPDRIAGIILTSPGSYPGTQAKRDYKTTNRGKIDLSAAVSAAANKIDKLGATAEGKLTQDEAGALFDGVVNVDLMGAMVCKGAKLTVPPPGKGGNLYANRMIAKDLDRLKFRATTAFNIPALILRGSCDFMPESNAADYAKLFKTSVTTLPQTGHGLLENTSAINSTFSAFVVGPLASVE